MKTKDQKETFIQLRAEGNSFDTISKKTGISKPTLIKWNVEFKKVIENLEYFKYQCILEQYKLTQQKRIEFLSEEINRLNEAIKNKNYEDMNLKELIMIRKELSNELILETKDKNYLTEVMTEYDPFSKSYTKLKLN